MWNLTNAAEARALVGGAAGFAAWMLILTVAVLTARGLAMLLEARRIDEFPAGVRHGGDRYWRLNRAHANAAENVGLVAAVLLAAVAAGIGGTDVRVLPWVIVAARVTQSVIHVVSGSPTAVALRFTAFVVQIASLGWLVVRIALAVL